MVDVHRAIVVHCLLLDIQNLLAFFGVGGFGRDIIVQVNYVMLCDEYSICILLQSINMEADTPKTILIFLINGVNSLLGWNAVLAALDYFQAAFESYNIYTYLPIPVFVGYIIVGSTYYILSNKYRYISLIVAGNMGINVALVAILLVSIVLKETVVGFLLLLFCALLIGVSANLSQLSFFAMINYLSQDVVSKFTVGTAVSGLFITVIRMIILAIFGSDNTLITPIIIYFIMALAFNTFDLFMNIAFCKSAVYKHKIEKFLVHPDEQLLSEEKSGVEDPLTNNESEETGSVITAVDDALANEEKRIEGQNYFMTLLETSKQIYPYPWIIMFTFVITFILFPGPSFSKTFDDLPISWSVILILLSYNIGDTVGKYVAQFKGIFNKKSLIFIFFARLIFFLPITVMATGADHDDASMNNYFFPFFNQLLFAITNGFCINASFIMAFKVCPMAYKKYAGVFCGLILQVGIISGTILQVPYGYIIGLN